MEILLALKERKKFLEAELEKVSNLIIFYEKTPLQKGSVAAKRIVQPDIGNQARIIAIELAGTYGTVETKKITEVLRARGYILGEVDGNTRVANFLRRCKELKSTANGWVKK